TLGIIWLVALALPTANLLDQHPDPARLILSLAGVALFAAIFAIVMVNRPFSRLQIGTPRPGGVASVVALVAISFALIFFDGRVWFDVLVFTTVYAGVVLPERQATRVVLALTVASFAFTRLYALDWNTTLGSVLSTLGGGMVTVGYGRLVTTVNELRAAREEVARLAVSEERLRIARNLHDLLGHSLSLITLKSELAVRLSRVEPERAAAEIQDVESIARQALQEMREAVSAYRQPTLASELSGARELLSAAGISLTYIGAETSDIGLLPATEATLAWAVREGVTNVIRHSRAQHCTIRLSREADCARLEMRDDGHGASEAAHGMASSGMGRHGNGLAGLRERVAALGGSCEAKSCGEDGGFQLTVTLPLGAAPSSMATVATRARGAAMEATVAG
ncbi:MAG TPA: sensor histidine kinase, partial [Ktedonobacterales bacterium]|nr:sensor histidine kinase [Ktedonobacterales bacterium]